MKVFLIIISFIFLTLGYITFHVDKCKVNNMKTDSFPIILGSFVGAIIDGFCWYIIIKYVFL
jgi:hypothetical protein